MVDMAKGFSRVWWTNGRFSKCKGVIFAPGPVFLIEAESYRHTQRTDYCNPQAIPTRNGFNRLLKGDVRLTQKFAQFGKGFSQKLITSMALF